MGSRRRIIVSPRHRQSRRSPGVSQIPLNYSSNAYWVIGHLCFSFNVANYKDVTERKAEIQHEGHAIYSYLHPAPSRTPTALPSILPPPPLPYPLPLPHKWPILSFVRYLFPQRDQRIRSRTETHCGADHSRARYLLETILPVPRMVPDGWPFDGDQAILW